MTSKSQWVALIAVAIIAVGGFFFPRTSQPFGSVQSGVDVTTTSFTTLSSANGISNGGIFTTAVRSAALTQATTTPCAIQGPNATSTVASASLLLTVSSSTASVITIATGANAFATTTLLGSGSIAANAMGTIFAAGTSTQAVLAPSQWVVFGMSGGIGTFSPTGVCEATFQVLN